MCPSRSQSETSPFGSWEVRTTRISLAVFRSVQGAAAPVLISAAVSPHVERRHRATFLSLDSLAGRLGWGIILFVVSTDADDAVQATLRVFAWISWSMVAVLVVSSLLVRRREPVAQLR